jgi:hypothetical protein
VTDRNHGKYDHEDEQGHLAVAIQVFIELKDSA